MNYTIINTEPIDNGTHQVTFQEQCCQAPLTLEIQIGTYSITNQIEKWLTDNPCNCPEARQAS